MKITAVNENLSNITVNKGEGEEHLLPFTCGSFTDVKRVMVTNTFGERKERILKAIPNRFTIKEIDKENYDVSLDKNFTVRIKFDTHIFTIKMSNETFQYNYNSTDIIEKNFNNILNNFFDYKFFIKGLIKNRPYDYIMNGVCAYIKNRYSRDMVCMVPKFKFNSEDLEIDMYNSSKIPYTFCMRDKTNNVKNMLDFFINNNCL